MSLNFSFKNTPLLARLGVDGLWAGEGMYGSKRLIDVADAMVWSSICVDVGNLLTQDLVVEHIARIQFWEGLNGPMYHWADGDPGWRGIDPADFVGLTVNVAPMSRLAWLKKLGATVPDPTTKTALSSARRDRPIIKIKEVV